MKRILTYVTLLSIMFFAYTSSLYGQQYVSQSAWAVGLVRGLGWEQNGIPLQPSIMDYFDLLSGRYFVNVELNHYATRLGRIPDTLTYNVNIQHSGRYHLVVYVYGNPLMITIDNDTVSSQVSAGWNYQDLGMYILKRGMHRISITIPQGSSISAFYLSSFASPAIQPKGGWVANETLDYGAEAQTLIMSMDVYNQLPIVSQIPFNVSGNGNIRELAFQLPSDPDVTLGLTFGGSSKGYVVVDNSVVINYGAIGPKTVPLKLKTLNLSQGQHIAVLKVVSGQMPTGFIIYRHNSTEESCVALMRALGFNMGLAYEAVPFDIALNSLNMLIAMEKKKPVSNNVFLSGMPVKEAELPSQKVLRTYHESISPMKPFEF
ncbi:MAG: hypothetical protein M1381_09370 [Deltaproteobacteria bacterium]|nr:hypothetical protein [Deltaproteobacteria bacterium]MCL5792758.1 hypothetical protein [Deltaproteobacteria bacterium]